MDHRKLPSHRPVERARNSRAKVGIRAVTPSPVHTSGEVFDDGSSLDLLLDTTTGNPCLLSSCGATHKLVTELTRRGHTYLPAKIGPSIIRAMRFPSSPGSFGSTAKLFASTSELFYSRGFPKEVAQPVTFFIFASWFPEFLPAAPCCVITGAQAEGEALLRLLGCVVRRPLRIAEFSKSLLGSLPMELRPTLLILGRGMRESAWALLHASNHRGVYLPRPRFLVESFCVKAVYCGDAEIGDDCGDGVLRVNVLPSRGRLPVLDSKEEKEISKEFQSKFVAYRAKNVLKVRDSNCDFPGFDSPIRILGRVLGAPIVDAPELQADLEPILRVRNEEAQMLRWLDLRCITLETLLHHCHSDRGKKLHVAEITKTVVDIMKSRGGATELEPEVIGRILRKIGFSCARDAKGYALRMDNAVCLRAHQLAVQYNVAAVHVGIAKCEQCAQTGTSRGEGD